jgi:hypothetical protein
MFRRDQGLRRLRQNVRLRQGTGARTDWAGLPRRHHSLISRTCFARAVQALMRNARSVPVET